MCFVFFYASELGALLVFGFAVVSDNVCGCVMNVYHVWVEFDFCGKGSETVVLSFEFPVPLQMLFV